MAKEWVTWNSPTGNGIKDIIQSQVGITDFLPYPFENIMVRETYEWGEYNSTKYGTHQALELQNVMFGKSGAAHFRADPNYRIKMLVYSENYDYFNDNVKSGMSDKLEVIKNAVGDSFIVFWLDGQTDDYVSCDIDGEHKGIGNFNLRLGNEWVFKDSKKMNNECYFVILEMEYYQEVDDEGITEPPTQEERESEAFANDDEYGDIDSGGGNGGNGGGDSDDEDPITGMQLLWFGLGLFVLASALGYKM